MKDSMLGRDDERPRKVSGVCKVVAKVPPLKDHSPPGEDLRLQHGRRVSHAKPDHCGTAVPDWQGQAGPYGRAAPGGISGFGTRYTPRHISASSGRSTPPPRKAASSTRP